MHRLAVVVRTAFGIDTRALAIFRIGLGGLLLVDLGLRTRLFSAFYTDDGVLPRATLAEAPWSPWAWSLHALSGEWWWQAVLFGVATCAAVALLSGWHTRVATVISWVLLVSLHNRNPIVLNGGDTLLRALLFWAMLIPLGAMWSLDQPGARPGRVCSVASAAILVQVLVMYVMTALFKRAPEWYVDGTALYYALSADAIVTPFGHWLLGFPDLLQWLTFTTIAIEVAAPLVLLSLRGRLRLVLIAAFVGLHLGSAATLYLGLFPGVCILAWTLFLPSRLWASDPTAQPVGSSPLVNVAATAVILLVLRFNLGTLPDGPPTPAAVNAAVHVFGLRQRWWMFAPRPFTDDGWYVAPAWLPDRRSVDLLRAGAPLDWTRPQSVAATYHMDRWRKYLLELNEPARAAYRQPLLDYLCRQSATRPDSVSLVFMLEQTPPPGEAPPNRARLPLAAGPCHSPAIVTGAIGSGAR